jgi:multidrug resistance efflux pump
MKAPALPPLYKREPEPPRRSWGKFLYLALLACLVLALGGWLGRRALYLDLPALVDGREFLVQCEEPGRVDQVLVEVGDPVPAGTVVARVDVTRRLADTWPPEMIFRIEEALTRLAGDAEVTAREIHLKGGVAAALAQERRRAQELLEQKILKYWNVKKLDLECRQAEAEVGKLKQRLTVLQKERQLLADLYHRFQQPAARVVTELRLPREGVVISRNRQPGEVVQAGQAVLTLVDPHDLKAFVAEKDQERVYPGQATTILFADGRRTPGTVKKVYPASEPLPPEYQDYYLRRQRALVAEIAAEQANPHRLVYGMRVRVRLPRSWW